MHKPFSTGLVWFRRDLRVADNAALFHALKNCHKVHCAFVFDTDILEALPTKEPIATAAAARRIETIE